MGEWGEAREKEAGERKGEGMLHMLETEILCCFPFKSYRSPLSLLFPLLLNFLLLSSPDTHTGFYICSWQPGDISSTRSASGGPHETDSRTQRTEAGRCLVAGPYNCDRGERRKRRRRRRRRGNRARGAKEVALSVQAVALSSSF